MNPMYEVWYKLPARKHSRDGAYSRKDYAISRAKGLADSGCASSWVLQLGEDGKVSVVYNSARVES